MPAFDTAVEFLACIVYAIVVVLVVYRPRQTISEHALCERRQGVDRVLIQESCCRGGIALSRRYIGVRRGSELEELVLG